VSVSQTFGMRYIRSGMREIEILLVVVISDMHCTLIISYGMSGLHSSMEGLT